MRISVSWCLGYRRNRLSAKLHRTFWSGLDHLYGDTMSFDEVLEKAIKATGVERYRYLCLEHPDPRVRESFRAQMYELAKKEPMSDIARINAAYLAEGFAPFKGGCCGGA